MSARITRRKIAGGYRLVIAGRESPFRVTYNEAAERPIRWLLEHDDGRLIAELGSVKQCIARLDERLRAKLEGASS